MKQGGSRAALLERQKNMPPKKVKKEVPVKPEEVDLNDNLITRVPLPIDPPSPVIKPGDEVSVAGQSRVVEKTTETTVTFKTPPPPPERLLTMRAVVSFTDGNLREAMEQHGYECEWRMNEVRKLPKWLIQRCVQSGAELERADG